MAFLTDRKRAVGHGASHTGTEHFIQQRLTAFALIFFIPMFLIFVAPLVGDTRAEAAAALSGFWRSGIAAGTLIFAGVHLIQGLQVVIEDYINTPVTRTILLFSMKAGITVLIIAGLWALGALAFA